LPRASTESETFPFVPEILYFVSRLLSPPAHLFHLIFAGYFQVAPFRRLPLKAQENETIAIVKFTIRRS
jgi:hypothetical protein